MGCASSGGWTERTLDLVGLQTKPPATADASALDGRGPPAPARRVTLRIHAGEILNSGDDGRSLSLVIRIYHLKDAGPLLRTPYPTLAENVGSKQPAPEGVIDVRELVLTPGQRYEVIDAPPAEATHLAIVGLFRTPDERRWRFVFDTNGAVRTGITIGAHGCAFSVAEGRPVDAPVESLRLAGARCR